MECAVSCFHNIPFSPSAQTSKNVGLTLRCVDCKKPHLIHSKCKLKLSDLNQLRALSEMQYVCGSTFAEFDAEGSSNIFDKVFVRENLSCTSEMELTYYSAAIFPDTCIHCGSKQNLVKSVENYPRCRSQECHKKGDVLRRKRKTVTVTDLKSKKVK